MTKNIARHITKTAALSYDHHVRRAIALLAVMCALAAFLYAFFLLEAVAHAASRTQAERHITALSAQVSGLEAQYLSQTQSVTPQMAQSLGYVTPTAIAQVYENSNTGALSLR